MIPLFCVYSIEMASITANSCNVNISSSGSLSLSVLVQEKASRNKRKYRTDLPVTDLDGLISLPQNDCSAFEFSAEFEVPPVHIQPGACKVHQDNSDELKLDLGLPSTTSKHESRSSQPREEHEAEDLQDVDWSDLTESQLEELSLANLDTIFKSAIRKIVGYGYSEEVTLKAILSSGLCYGSKDTVTNIVDNTLAFLRNVPMIKPLSVENYFDDLQQLERYILAELVCVLREVRPFFSIGDAMWCLLISDMNLSHACAVDGDSLCGFLGDGGSSGGDFSIPSPPQESSFAKSSDLGLVDGSAPIPAIPCSHLPRTEEIPLPSSHYVLDKVSKNLTPDTAKKSNFSLTSQAHVAEKSKKGLSATNKRDYILKQKSLHLEKHLREHGSKSFSKTLKLSSLSGSVLDKKSKPGSVSTSINIKNCSLKITGKVTAVHVSQDNENHTSVSITDTSAEMPKASVLSALPAVSRLPEQPALKASPTLSASDMELSLSVMRESNSKQLLDGGNEKGPNYSVVGRQFDKSSGQWVPNDKKDEIILSLIPKIQELQNQLQEWSEWANQKVMQAARRLTKDKAELKMLKQDKEEIERLNKEKQSLEESTMKKLTEMEIALFKADGQVERANSAVRRLEFEKESLRQQMEAAKLHAAESATNFQEVSKREKKTLMKFQTWDKQRILLQEELLSEKDRLSKLLQNVEQAKICRSKVEVY